MIKPKFFLDQDDQFVYVHVFIKYAKISDIEIEIEENKFWFYLKPYHLNITLPSKIVSDSREKLEYNVEGGEIIFSIPKLNPGEFFEDLDMIAKLLQPGRTNNKIPVIEVIGEDGIHEDTCVGSGYGFNRKEKNLFLNRLEEMQELFDVNPEIQDLEERIANSIKQENQDWSLDRYLEDLDIDVLNAKPEKIYKNYIPNIIKRMEDLSLDTVVKLGNKSLLVHKDLVRAMLIQICDLVFSFCCEIRCMGELSCESPVIINKISATLSCLVEYKSLLEMSIKISRRFLIYSLYRNLEILQKAWQDTQYLFSQGKSSILRVLVKLKNIFDASEPRYLLNRIFIDDFIIWVQKTDDFDDFMDEVCSFSLPEIETLDLDFNIQN
jgi:protein SHQ1